MKKSCLLFALASFFLNTANAQLDEGKKSFFSRDYKAAISSYERAELSNPNNLELRVNLAHSYRYTNQMDKAEKNYELALKTPNVPINTYYYYGQVLMANKNYVKAKAVFEKFKTLASNDIEKSLATQAQAACDFAVANATSLSAFTVRKEMGVSSTLADDYAPVIHNGELLFASTRRISITVPGTTETGYSNPDLDAYLHVSKISATGTLAGLQVYNNKKTNMAPFAVVDDESRAVSSDVPFHAGTRHIRGSNLDKAYMEIHIGMKQLTDLNPFADFPLPVFNDDDIYAITTPCFANNGNSIYFAVDNYPGGYGGWDIWVIHQQGNNWTKPQNLGPNVNTAGDELCPHVLENGQMYFSSNTHKGFGGFDVFRAQQSNNVWKDIRNLGNKVNSPSDDMYFVFDPVKKFGFFSSNRGGNLDIYSAILSGNELSMPNVLTNEQNIAMAGNTTGNTSNNGNTNGNNSNTYGSTNGNNTLANNNNNNGSGNVEVTKEGGYKPHSNSTTKPTNTGNVVTTTPTNPTTTPTTPTNTNTSNGSTVPCAMNFYVGAIVDEKTNRPLQGALVYVQNIKTGEQNKLSNPTNPYGEYSVLLDPMNDYTISISKTGFKDLIFDVSTGTGGKKTLLSTRPMSATALLERDRFGNVVEPNDVAVNTTPTKDELLNPIRSTGKTFSYEPNGTAIPNKGYMIQALVATKLTEEERMELGQYGNLITEDRGNKKAFRVGVFADEKHMNEALTEIRKTYRDAFKIPVELDNNHLGGRIALSSQMVYPLPPAKPLPELKDDEKRVDPATNNVASVDGPSSTDQPIVKENDRNDWTANNKYPEGTTPRGGDVKPVATPKEDVVLFKVQLGAFKEADNITYSNISHLGMIEKQQKGNGLTYFYIASFKTLSEARNARTKAQEGGVPSPFIVAFKNGQRVKISEVVPAN